MASLTFHGTAQDGRIKFTEYNSARLRQELTKLQGKPLVVTITPKQRIGPSTRMRGYYRAAVVPSFAGEWKVSEDEAHEILKYAFNYKSFKIKDKTHRVGLSTEQLPFAEYMEYLLRIHAYAGENGIYIPPARNYDVPELL
jgi:hypothetical protein